MGIDNDTRGWVMTVVSGIACTVGASIICVDLIIRQLPGKKNFKIEESNMFLSCGLSLSFGVMIFSSLYSILPSSKKYLQGGGMSPKIATLTLIGCFLSGAIGISVLSQILHRYIPHKVVDCDHGHDDEEEGKVVDEEHRNGISQGHVFAQEAEEYPSYGTANEPHNSRTLARRPSLHAQISSKVSLLVTGSKEFCDENGQCFGYSDRACGQECFRNVQHGGRPSRLGKTPTRLSGLRAQTTPHERQPLLQDVDETAVLTPITPTTSGPATMESSTESLRPTNGHSHAAHKHSHSHSHDSLHSYASSSSSHESSDDHHQAHHHHVPKNAFLSIGLQTSIAIALHKIPEGFITYATNHANPRLGFSIFLALFIHNITEGFAMALPLYLAINSRWKAMFWSALLGGVSQPLGAGVAALWFRIAGRDGTGEPGDTVYGAMFAITAGIMAMVSLQLLSESLDLTHSRRACFASAFCGMGILGLSSALTA
ncbi:Zip-domain-containing protein [Melanomma pulvis-pyrius CBS 109.77]|uniref:Zip-domain-containing protein n=1 Tax=Melanomma pulvis-pyrius CBS 109.77 TaxID=1314802 RepID=A0A6A6WPT9_9PLEO|nr:Zip-domain-containing protein [Melanomma pulvis-pyrius CBS 109.77]